MSKPFTVWIDKPRYRIEPWIKEEPTAMGFWICLYCKRNTSSSKRILFCYFKCDHSLAYFKIVNGYASKYKVT